MMQTATRGAVALHRNASQRTLTALVRHEQRHGNNLLSPSSHLHTFALSRDDRDNKEERARLQSLPPSTAAYHTTAPAEKGAALVLGLGAVSATAFAASSAVRAYNEWKESLPETPPEQPAEAKEEAQQEQKAQQKEEKRENIFAKWFNVGVGSKYYEGGFEDTMTRKYNIIQADVRRSGCNFCWPIAFCYSYFCRQGGGSNFGCARIEYAATHQGGTSEAASIKSPRHWWFYVYGRKD